MGETAKLFIVGGGPSLCGFDFSRLGNKSTVVVNNSVFDVPNPNYFITMDYTWLTKNSILDRSRNREKFLSKGIHKVFVVSFAGDRTRCEWTSKGVKDKYFDLEYDLSLFDQIIPAAQYGGIGVDIEDFRCGSDSGFCALQLGTLLGYKRIYLLGMDFDVVKSKPVMIETKPERREGWVSINRSVIKGPRRIVAIKSCNKSHYHKEISRGLVKEFEKRLEEYLIPYPVAFQEISEKTDSEVFSCSTISKLNEFIPYVNIEKALEE